MNFYKHHIGDYAAATSHLSFIEDAAYSRLLRRYYSTEKPLPADTKAVARLVGARSPVERAAVELVLAEFFTLEADGWHQKRCDEEIGIAQGKANHNREVGKLGGRPPAKITQRVSKTEPRNNPGGYFSEPTDNPLQTPDSRSQTPEAKKDSEEDSEKTQTQTLRVSPINGKPRPKIQIPEDFVLTEPMRDQALKRYPDVDADEMFVQFRAHHESHGKAMISWTAAWTTWIGNAQEFGYPKRQTTVRKWD